MDPKMWQFIIQLVMGLAAQSQAPQSDPYDVDLDAVRDRFGMRDVIRGGAAPKPPPLEVNVMNAPMPYATGP